MASRKPEDLHPDLQPLYRKWKQRCERAGLDVLLICTYRSNAEQEALYAQGRTAPGNIVTRARAGQSEHNALLNGQPASRAFDFCLLVNGKPSWATDGNGVDDNPLDDATDHLEMWQRAGAIAEELGLNWYGKPGSPFREFPHVALKKS